MAQCFRVLAEFLEDRVQYPALTSGSFQAPVTPARGFYTLFPTLRVPVFMRAHRHTLINEHMHK